MSDDRASEERIMPAIPNSLTFSQEHVNIVLGYAMASLYQDVLAAPIPEHLTVLLAQLDGRSPGDMSGKSDALRHANIGSGVQSGN